MNAKEGQVQDRSSKSVMGDGKAVLGGGWGTTAQVLRPSMAPPGGQLRFQAAPGTVRTGEGGSGKEVVRTLIYGNADGLQGAQARTGRTGGTGGGAGRTEAVE